MPNNGSSALPPRQKRTLRDKKRNANSSLNQKYIKPHVHNMASGTNENDSDEDLAYFTSEEFVQDDYDNGYNDKNNDNDYSFYFARQGDDRYSPNGVSPKMSWSGYDTMKRNHVKDDTAYPLQNMNSVHQRPEQGEAPKRDSESSDIAGSSVDVFSSDDEEEGDEEDEEEEEDVPMFLTPISADLGLPSSLHPNISRKHKRKQRGPIRRLRRQLANSGNQEKQNRRQRRRREKGKAKHHDLVHGMTTEIDHHLVQVEFARNRLQNVKANLKVTRSRAKKLILSAQQSANRVSKLSKNILELECKLDMSMRALEQEKVAISDHMSKLAYLNETEQGLEEEAHSIDANLRALLNHVESICLTRPEENGNGHRIEQDGNINVTMQGTVTPRKRAGTETSVIMTKTNIPSPSVTTKNGTTPLRRRSRSYNDLRNEDLQSQNLEQEVVMPMPFTTCMPHEEHTNVATLTRMASYLRIHDLEMENAPISLKENNGGGNRADLYPIHSHDSHHVLKSLMNLAFKYVTDESDRWTPDRATEKILSKRPTCDHKWHYATDSDVFVWYGKFESGYKSELPVIKARASVKTSARNLLDLLVDSSKVTQYNKMSLGREDKEFIKEGIETDDGKIHGEAKIVRSVSNIPMIRKKLELLSLMHARALDEKRDGMKGYMIVSRSVWEDEKQVPSEDGGDGDYVSDSNYIRSEILLGVNLIREVDDEADKCEITTINHFYTPGTPTFGARQFGMKAAANFLKDLQNKFE